MTLDVLSLALGIGLVALTAAASLVLLADERDEASGYGSWAAGLGLQGSAMLAFGTRTFVPSSLADLIAIGCYLASLAFLITSAARLRGSEGHPRVVGVLLALPLLGSAWYALVDPLPEMRTLLVGAGALLGFVLLALETGRLGREERRPATVLLHAVTLTVLVVMILRAIEAVTGDAWRQAASTPANLALFATGAVFFVGSALALSGLFNARARDALDATRAALEQQARTDVLTGLANRRAFAARLERETLRGRRYDRPLSLLIVDVDHFKAVNDRFGHPVGDAVLAHLAQLLSDATRSSDHVARVGGEEFAIVLPETGTEDARELGERIRGRATAEPHRTRDGTPIPVTLSIGAASFQAGEDADALYRRADRALYRAKDTGRDRLVTAD